MGIPSVTQLPKHPLHSTSSLFNWCNSNNGMCLSHSVPMHTHFFVFYCVAGWLTTKEKQMFHCQLPLLQSLIDVGNLHDMTCWAGSNSLRGALLFNIIIWTQKITSRCLMRKPIIETAIRQIERASFTQCHCCPIIIGSSSEEQLLIK